MLMVTWCAVMTAPAGASTSLARTPWAKRLYDEMLETNRYDKLIRPVGNTSESLTVKIGLRLTSIIDVVSLSTIRLSVCNVSNQSINESINQNFFSPVH